MVPTNHQQQKMEQFRVDEDQNSKVIFIVSK